MVKLPLPRLASLGGAMNLWETDSQLLFLAPARFARNTQNNTSPQLPNSQHPPQRTKTAAIFNTHRVKAAPVLSTWMKRRRGIHNSSGMCFVFRFNASVKDRLLKCLTRRDSEAQTRPTSQDGCAGYISSKRPSVDIRSI